MGYDNEVVDAGNELVADLLLKYTAKALANMGYRDPVGGGSAPTIASGRSDEYAEVIFSEKTNWGWAEGRVTIMRIDEDPVGIFIGANITDEGRIEKILTIEETAAEEFAIDGVEPFVDTENAEENDPDVFIEWEFGSGVAETIAEIAKRLSVYQYIQEGLEGLEHGTLTEIAGEGGYIQKEIKKLAETLASSAVEVFDKAIKLIDSMTPHEGDALPLWDWEE